MNVINSNVLQSKSQLMLKESKKGVVMIDRTSGIVGIPNAAQHNNITQMQNAELALEIEALNSIYGDDTLTLSSHTNSEAALYILALPAHATTLRLQFPPDYPASPPAVLGPESSGEGSKRGEAASIAECFKDILGKVFRQGEVVLYDAIEEFQQTYQDPSPTLSSHDQHEVLQAAGRGSTSMEDIVTLNPPDWIAGKARTVQKSIFLAHATAITSPDLIKPYVAHLLNDASKKKLRLNEATHNILAWRVRIPPTGSSAKETWHEDYDDDGEGEAGRRVLEMMQFMDVENCLVVVSRWFGGIKLGGRRFGCIVEAAREAVRVKISEGQNMLDS